ATVPLQDGRLAARVLEEALDSGFHGAMIATQPKGVGGNLDDPSLDPFWEVASVREAALFLHPHYICGDERLADYDLVNAVGRPAPALLGCSDRIRGRRTLRRRRSGRAARGGGARDFRRGRGADLPGRRRLRRRARRSMIAQSGASKLLRTIGHSGAPRSGEP